LLTAGRRGTQQRKGRGLVTQKAVIHDPRAIKTRKPRERKTRQKTKIVEEKEIQNRQSKKRTPKTLSPTRSEIGRKASTRLGGASMACSTHLRGLSRAVDAGAVLKQ